MRSLLVVDAERFTSNPDAELPGMHRRIREVLDVACERSGLGEAWANTRFRQSTGDGVLALLPLDSMIELTGRFGDRLQEVLAERAPELRARGLRLRLRVALHVGRVDDLDPVTAGIGTATNDVSRLLDCAPLRAELDRSDPDVTFVAVVVSEQAFDMFVRGGHTEVGPSRFTPVRAQVKQFDKPAYVYVPKPSWRTDAEAEVEEAPPAAAPGGQSFGNVRISGRNSQNVVGGTVNGGMHQGR